MAIELADITVFVDRDGTLNHDSGYLTTPDELILFPGVVEAAARLKSSGCRLILVTNQSAVGRGFMTVAELKVIHDKLELLLKEGGGTLDGIFFCPHHPDEHCACRKPRPGLIWQAVDSLGVQTNRSYMVGDKRSDMELAFNVGAVGVFVGTCADGEKNSNTSEHGMFNPAHIATGFPEAVDWILQDAGVRKW